MMEDDMTLLLDLIYAPAMANNHKLTTIFLALTPFFATANASSRILVLGPALQVMHSPL